MLTLKLRGRRCSACGYRGWIGRPQSIDHSLAYAELTAEATRSRVMDEDLDRLSREELIAEVKRLRGGIREHRDSSGHDLCWHHPQLWGLLPERTAPEIAVPPWPNFLHGCIKYREALERELPRVTSATTVDEREGLNTIK